MNLFLFNPLAKKARLKNKIIDYLNHLKVAGEFVEVRKKEDIAKVAEQALKQKVDNVIVIGGDGMVNRLIQYLVKEKVNVGIIPIGETNFLAHILRINDWKRGCEILANPRVVQINLGLISKERYFTSSIEISGKDQESKRFWGIFKKRSKKKYHPVTINIEGDRTKFKVQANISSLIITTIPIPLPKNFKIDDMINDQDLRTIIKSKPQSRHRHDEITTVKGRKVEIESKGALYIKADGEHSGKASVNIEMVPRCLNMIVPEEK